MPSSTNRTPVANVTKGPALLAASLLIIALGLTAEGHRKAVVASVVRERSGPCNIALMRQAPIVKAGRERKAGGTPREFCPSRDRRL